VQKDGVSEQLLRACKVLPQDKPLGEQRSVAYVPHAENKNCRRK
jgi:hypothetical protein